MSRTPPGRLWFQALLGSSAGWIWCYESAVPPEHCSVRCGRPERGCGRGRRREEARCQGVHRLRCPHAVYAGVGGERGRSGPARGPDRPRPGRSAVVPRALPGRLAGGGRDHRYLTLDRGRDRSRRPGPAAGPRAQDQAQARQGEHDRHARRAGPNRRPRAGPLPPGWIPPGLLRDPRDLPRTRRVRTRERTRLKHRIHATLAQAGLRLEGRRDRFRRAGPGGGCASSDRHFIFIARSSAFRYGHWEERVSLLTTRLCANCRRPIET